MEKEQEHNDKDNNDDIENDGSSCIEVTDMINKAKRTAGSLWMILHAQCCQNPSCLVIGCSQTRELLSHVKTCPAGPGFDCPQCVNGCSQARKLLTHYRHCRDMRNRRVNNANNGRSVKTTGHACLICTLAARHEPKRMEVKPRPLASTSRLSRISLSKIQE